MNERIKKLLAQAHLECGPDTKKVAERYAELIVQECLNTVGHYTNVDEGIAVAKKNFGVE